ncbi:putative FAD-linked oxidase [Gordonia polyisoprenivorans NBRC 16320 = JCM 10675]|uniref:FAD-binding protein n=1 Tax=Gordonia polyisoprenivorans TaxID=84595 RepID=A0A846WTU3_9ACTN|nr:FAD-linked oxidase C-terminal domain-containing protein [Gordonia polyisoprenivorans]MBE7192609.1 FAD-binding protein [Gordonia polyisoprenivorans]NKY04537.1 FAD-binding protein [Gordonia polyisoprenivorans]QUD83205.1 FAD-binding protein [Gordonia polyisoprenivorans]UZF55924.1 FAD-binding protein [Gordonia polyisoprenivorans]GAB23287.1 putative FAD-linked oxidase [Gordonia polyisoprenivorans NBRC 16320 = JCM 10675]
MSSVHTSTETGSVDLADLRADLPDQMIVTDPDILAGYRQDRAFDPTAGTPLALIRPTTTEHVQTVVRWCAAHRVPIITRGAGTSLSGGSTAVDGAVMLSTEKMREMSIDTATRTAVVQPGLFNAEVKAAAAAHDLWYPPDPSSFEICSIGGNVATNAGGLCCVKYGVTTDYVLGMQVVLADGRAIRLGGKQLKDSAGLSLTKLFVGSEGLLGIITEVTLRLLPPQASACTVVGTFSSVHSASEAVLAITARIRPAMLEFMDKVSINAVEDMLRMGLDRDAGALLVAQSDAPGPAGVAEVEIIREAFESCGAAEVFDTTDAAEGEAFTAARRAAIPAVEKLGSLLLEDVGVPLPALPALIDGVGRIASDNAVMISVIAHAGDGNTHPLIVFDPDDADEHDRAQTAFGQVMDLAISLGGTITGEHGVGRLKKGWLPDQVGPDVMELTAAIKATLDPDGLLNPGVIL